MIQAGDWVIYKGQESGVAVLAIVAKINGSAYYLDYMVDGKQKPLKTVTEKDIVPAPISQEADPFLVDLALQTGDKKWFDKLRGTAK